MKTLFRILTILALFLVVAAPFSEAVSIKPKSQVGEVLHAIGKSGRQINQQPMAAFYKSLTPRGRRGVALIVSAAINEKGNAPSASHVMRALSRVAGTLELSAHNMTLPQFLDELPKLMDRFKNDPQSLEALNRMLVGLTTNVKQSGVHELPLFTHALGTSAELADCAKLLPVIQKLAPRVGGRKWVEAHCKGKIGDIGMEGDWLLEVKCWRRFSGERALRRLGVQSNSTYLRLIPPPIFDKVSGMVEAHGYVVRFAAAGKDGENLATFAGALKNGVRSALMEEAKVAFPNGVPAQVKNGIAKFVREKVIVTLVE